MLTRFTAFIEHFIIILSNVMQISKKFVLTIEFTQGATMFMAAATARKSTDVCNNTLCGIVLADAPVLAANGHLTNDMQARADCTQHGNAVVLAYTRLPSHTAKQFIQAYLVCATDEMYPSIVARAADAIVTAAKQTCVPMAAMFHTMLTDLPHSKTRQIILAFQHCRNAESIRLIGATLPRMSPSDLRKTPDAFQLLQTMQKWQSIRHGRWWQHLDALIKVYKRCYFAVQARTQKSIALITNLFVATYRNHSGDHRLARLIWHLLAPCIDVTQLDHSDQIGKLTGPLLQNLATQNCSVLLAHMLASFQPREYKTLSTLGHMVISCVLQGMTRWAGNDTTRIVQCLPLSAVACSENSCAYAAIVKLSAVTGADYTISLLHARAARHNDYAEHCAKGCPMSTDSHGNPLMPLLLTALANKKTMCLFSKVQFAPGFSHPDIDAHAVGIVHKIDDQSLQIKFPCIETTIAVCHADVLHAGTSRVVDKLYTDSTAMQPLQIMGSKDVQSVYMSEQIAHNANIIGPLKYTITCPRTVSQIRHYCSQQEENNDHNMWLWTITHGNIALNTPLKVVLTFDIDVRHFVNMLMRACLRLAYSQGAACRIWHIVHTGTPTETATALKSTVLSVHAPLKIPDDVFVALQDQVKLLWQAVERMSGETGAANIVFAAFKHMRSATLKWYGGNMRLPYYTFDRPKWLHPEEHAVASFLINHRASLRRHDLPYMPTELLYLICTFL